MLFVIGVWTFLRALLLGSAAIALENLALRHQLRVLQRSVRRPRLARWDRILWGLAVPGLGGLAFQSRHRPAGDGARMAPPRLPALLAMEVQAELGRPPEARRRDSAPDPPDGARRRIRAELAPAGVRGGWADGREVHAPAVTSAVAHGVRRCPLVPACLGLGAAHRSRNLPPEDWGLMGP